MPADGNALGKGIRKQNKRLSKNQSFNKKRQPILLLGCPLLFYEFFLECLLLVHLHNAVCCDYTAKDYRYKHANPGSKTGAFPYNKHQE